MTGDVSVVVSPDAGLEERAISVLAQAFTDAGQASVGRYIAAGNELIPDQPVFLAAMLTFARTLADEARRDERERCAGPLRLVVAHATGGAVQDCSGMSVNDISVAITQHRNRVWDSARDKVVNSPETADFMAGVPLEAAHQRERWSVDHDAGKTPFGWFWLIGYLAQKAASAQVAGDTEKAKHHTISTAAALANWHAQLSGLTAMRPGIGPGNGGDKPGSAYNLASKATAIRESAQ
jgi:hypothetical protein